MSRRVFFTLAFPNKISIFCKGSDNTLYGLYYISHAVYCDDKKMKLCSQYGDECKTKFSNMKIKCTLSIYFIVMFKIKENYSFVFLINRINKHKRTNMNSLFPF